MLPTDPATHCSAMHIDAFLWGTQLTANSLLMAAAKSASLVGGSPMPSITAPPTKWSLIWDVQPADGNAACCQPAQHGDRTLVCGDCRFVPAGCKVVRVDTHANWTAPPQSSRISTAASVR